MRLYLDFSRVVLCLALSVPVAAQFTPGAAPAFPSPYPFPFPLQGVAPAALVAGDFNSDGVADIVVANKATNNISVVLSNGVGGFTLGGPYSVGLNPGALALLGIDKAGYLELAVANQGDNTISILFFTPQTGNLAKQTTVGSQWGLNSPSALASGVFRTGGNVDLVIANRGSNSVVVVRGDGTGTFTPYSASPIVSGVGQGPSSIAIADFDLDGNFDIAVTNEFDNTVTVLRGGGNGGFSAFPTSPFATGSNPVSIATADFNGDGRPDLAIANYTSNNVTVLLGTGLGSFTPLANGPLSTGAGPEAIVTADFNLDLLPDLAIANYKASTITVWEGAAAGGFSAGAGSPFAVQTGVATNPIALAVSDFNADGAPDLAIADYATAEVSVLLNSLAAAPSMTSNASYTTGAPAAPGSVVSIFGTNLDTLPQLSAADDQTYCLNDTTVTLKDAAGIQYPLPLLYVSPGLIDAVIPPALPISSTVPSAGTASPGVGPPPGAATFTVAPSSECPPPVAAGAMPPSQLSAPQKGSTTIAVVAPALYTANGTGKGAANGYVYDLVTGAEDTSLFSCGTTPGPPPVTSCSPAQIDVTQGAPALVLYGTGIRDRAALSNVTVTVGTQSLPLFYAGPAGGYPLIDQVNVNLPPTLAGAGTVLVTVAISGTPTGTVTSNSVAINIK
jgi:uncharacterized protein (TIGR03437 family)